MSDLQVDECRRKGVPRGSGFGLTHPILYLRWEKVRKKAQREKQKTSSHGDREVQLLIR
jgi:hypothetical protein